MKVVVSSLILILSLETFAQRPPPAPKPPTRPGPTRPQIPPKPPLPPRSTRPPQTGPQIPDPHRPGPSRPGRPQQPIPPHRRVDYELDHIEQVLSTGGWQARQYAVMDLGHFPTPRALVIALKALNDSDRDVIQAAKQSVQTLLSSIDFHFHSLNILQSASPLLKSGSWLQRAHAAQALGQVPTSAAIIPLLHGLNDNDRDVLNAIKVSLNIVVLNPDLRPIVRDNKEVLEGLFRRGNWFQRSQIMRVIGLSQVVIMIPLVVEAAGDNDNDVIREANTALNILTKAPHYPRVNMNIIKKLEQLYNTKGWRVRLNAIRALGATFNPAVRPILFKALDDSDADVRRAAQIALRNI